MPANPILTDQQKELIAVGASIAAGCRPCTKYHFEKTRETGATVEEIRNAVDLALTVRESATETMARLADEHLGSQAGTSTPNGAATSLLDELISVSAALALNDTAGLGRYVASAKQHGATGPQLKTAIAIARMVKKVAAQKADEALDAIWPDTEKTRGCNPLPGGGQGFF